MTSGQPVPFQNPPNHTGRGGSRGGHVLRREQAERHVDTLAVGKPSEEDWEGEPQPPVGGDGVPSPSRVRKGVWSAMGRAIDSLIGTISSGGGNPQHHTESELESSSHSTEQDRVEPRHRRPPTDAELRARVVHSPPSGQPRSRPRQTSEAAGSREFEAPSATEKTTVKVPISLTPMQPPPDVLAAMKGRAAVGRRRARFTAPPADVVAALETTRQTNNHETGAALGEVGYGKGGMAKHR